MKLFQQLANVIEAGNKHVPVSSQLLRVVSVGDSTIVVEHRPSLDVPFMTANLGDYPPAAVAQVNAEVALAQFTPEVAADSEEEELAAMLAEEAEKSKELMPEAPVSENVMRRRDRRNS